jgi:hypothetical protein
MEKVNINKLKEYQQNDTLVVVMTNVVTIQRNPSRNGIPTAMPNLKDCLGQIPSQDQMNLVHYYGPVTIILKKSNGCQLVSQDLKRTCQENVGKIQGKGIMTHPQAPQWTHYKSKDEDMKEKESRRTP